MKSEEGNVSSKVSAHPFRELPEKVVCHHLLCHSNISLPDDHINQIRQGVYLSLAHNPMPAWDSFPKELGGKSAAA